MKILYIKYLIALGLLIFSSEISPQVNAGYIALNFHFAGIEKSIYGSSSYLEKSSQVEISVFNAHIVKSNVYLIWQAKAEGNSFKFKIERMTSDDMVWRNIGEVKSLTNNNPVNTYTFKDKNLPGGFYSYRLKISYDDGSFDYSSEVNTEIDYTDEL